MEAFLAAFLSLCARMPLYVLLTATALLAAGGDYLAKRWSLAPSGRGFLVAFCVYASSNLFLFPALQREKLLVVGILYDLFTGTAFLLVGVLFFHERLRGLQLVGLVLGVLSVLAFVLADVLE